MLNFKWFVFGFSRVRGKLHKFLMFGCFFLCCASKGSSIVRDNVSTFAQARENYLAGLKALKDGDYPKAMEYFQTVARGPSYLEYSAIARLRIGDTLLLQERYEEAIDQYRDFIDTSQGHPNLHYAYFRLAEAYVKSIPQEFVLLPPKDRKDQRKVRTALQALNDFIDRFPNSPFILEALTYRDEMIKTVVSYESEVARFYLSRNKPKGAINRIERLIEELPQASSNEDVHVLLATAFLKAKDNQGLAKECERYRLSFSSGVRQDRMRSICGTISDIK